MEHENDNNEISLMDIWSKIWKNKFLIIIITGVFLIIGTIGIFFANKNSAKLTTKFNYEYIYRDNSKPFDYTDILSEKYLKVAKSSHDDFKNINIEKILSDNNTKILLEIERKTDGTETSRNYKIEFSLKHFDNNAQLAERFTDAVHEANLSEMKELNEGLLIFNALKKDTTLLENVSQPISNLTYHELFSLVEKQANRLTSSYNDFASKINSSGFQTGSNSIHPIKNEYDLWLVNDLKLNDLAFQITNEGYFVNPQRTIDIATINAKRIQNEIDDNEALLIKLKEVIDTVLGDNGILGDNAIINKINELESRNNQLKRSNKYNEMFANKSVDDLLLLVKPEQANFDVRFKGLVDDLNQFTDAFNEIYLNFLNDHVVIKRVNNDLYVVETKFNLPLMVVVIGMIGGVISLVVVFVKEGMKKEDNLEQLDLTK